MEGVVEETTLRGRTMFRAATSTDRFAGAGLALTAFLMSMLVSLWMLGFAAMTSNLADDRTAAMSSLSRDLSAVDNGWFGNFEIQPSTTAEQYTQLETWTQAYGPIFQQLTDVKNSFPQELREIVGEPQFRLTSQEVPVETKEGSDVRFPSVQPAFAPDLHNRISLTDGRYPARTQMNENVEFIVSQAAANRLSWEIGESRTSLLAPNQPLELVGTYEAIDPGDGYWQHATTSLEPQIDDDPNAGISVMATAYLAPDQYYESLGTQRLDAWLPIDEMRGQSALEIAQQLTVVSATTHAQFANLVFGSGLAEELRHIPADINSSKTLAIFLLCVPLLALAVSALVAIGALAKTHRHTLLLLSARGASSTHKIWWSFARSAALTLPATALGVLCAWAFIGDPTGILQGPTPWMPPILLSVLLALALAVAVIQQKPSHFTRSTSKVWMFAALVVTAGAALSAYLVLTEVVAKSDAIAYVMPALVALAIALCGVAAIRPITSALSAALGRMKNTTLYLALAQSSRSRSGTTQSMMSIIIATTMIVMSMGVLLSLRSAITTGAVEKVGADIRISGPVYTEEHARLIKAMPQVRSVARIMHVTPAGIRTGAGQSSIRFYVADPVELNTLDAYSNEHVNLAPTTSENINAIGAAQLAEKIHENPNHTLNSALGQFSIDHITQEVSLPGINSSNSFLLASTAVLPDSTKYRPRIILIDLASGLSEQETQSAVNAIEALLPIGVVELERDAIAIKSNDATIKWLNRAVIAGLVVTAIGAVCALSFAIRASKKEREYNASIYRQLGIETKAIRTINTTEVISWLAPSIGWGAVGGGLLAWLALQIVDVSNITGLARDIGTRHIVVLVGYALALALASTGSVFVQNLTNGSQKMRKS